MTASHKTTVLVGAGYIKPCTQPREKPKKGGFPHISPFTVPPPPLYTLLTLTPKKKTTTGRAVDMGRLDSPLWKQTRCVPSRSRHRLPHIVVVGAVRKEHRMHRRKLTLDHTRRISAHQSTRMLRWFRSSPRESGAKVGRCKTPITKKPKKT